MATDSISYYFQDSAPRYKSLNGTSPRYLAQKLHYRSHTRSLRSNSNELLMQPRSYSKTDQCTLCEDSTNFLNDERFTNTE